MRCPTPFSGFFMKSNLQNRSVHYLNMLQKHKYHHLKRENQVKYKVKGIVFKLYISVVRAYRSYIFYQNGLNSTTAFQQAAYRVLKSVRSSFRITIL